MNDWIVFTVGCFATLLAGVGAGLVIYAVNTDEGSAQDRARLDADLKRPSQARE